MIKKNLVKDNLKLIKKNRLKFLEGTWKNCNWEDFYLGNIFFLKKDNILNKKIKITSERIKFKKLKNYFIEFSGKEERKGELFFLFSGLRKIERFKKKFKFSNLIKTYRFYSFKDFNNKNWKLGIDIFFFKKYTNSRLKCLEKILKERINKIGKNLNFTKVSFFEFFKNLFKFFFNLKKYFLKLSYLEIIKIKKIND